MRLVSCNAGVAQSVEQLICNQQVGGSSPSTSSNSTYARQGYHKVVFLTSNI